MKLRSRQAFLGTLGAPLALSATRPTIAAETYTMRLSISTPATALQGVCGKRFADAVERRTNGQLKIEVYPSSQLAKEQESIDSLTTGTIDFSIQATAYLLQLFPRFQVFDAPFLFKDIGAAYRVLDSSVASQLFAELEPKGIVGLTWGMTGFRKIETTNKPVVSPEDLRGLRIRIAGSAIYVATYQALGALPVQIGDSEVYTAATQHTIDALDLPLNGFTSFKLYTVMKHLAQSNHVFTLNPLMASKRRLESLPVPLQKIVKEEGKALVPFWRSLYAKGVNDNMQILTENGMNFTEIQYAAFRKAVAPVYAMVQAKLGGDILARVTRVANAG